MDKHRSECVVYKRHHPCTSEDIWFWTDPLNRTRCVEWLSYDLVQLPMLHCNGLVSDVYNRWTRVTDKFWLDINCPMKSNLHVWMNICMSEWIFACLNEYLDVWMNICMSEWIFACLNEYLHVWMNICMSEWIFACLNEYLQVWMNICMSEWIFASLNEYLQVWMNICRSEWVYRVC